MPEVVFGRVEEQERLLLLDILEIAQHQILTPLNPQIILHHHVVHRETSNIVRIILSILKLIIIIAEDINLQEIPDQGFQT